MSGKRANCGSQNAWGKEKQRKWKGKRDQDVEEGKAREGRSSSPVVQLAQTKKSALLHQPIEESLVLLW